MVSVSRHGTATVVWVVVLIVTAGLAPVSVAVADTTTADRSLQVDTEPANNTSIVHENPQSADEEGNLSELQQSLSDRLGETLIDCSEGLEVGQYDACNRSGNYPDWLDKYVNVTRDSNSDTNKTTAFDQARENQSSYATAVQRFRSTVDQYRTARQNGRTQRAQRLARRAQRLARHVNETGGRLTRDYRTIDNGTTQNFSAAINTTNAVTDNVTTVAESVSVEQFKNTTITASTADQRAAFDDPLVVSGRLATPNGTPLANRTIALAGDDQLQRTTTDESGRYTITYQPTLLPLDTRRLTVRYRPSTQSIYRSNRTTVPVSIQQTTPTIRAQTASQTVGFDDLLSITGRVAVNETGVGSLPVAISVGGEEIRPADESRVRTGADGRFRIARELPADVASGRQTVRVSLPIENRSIASTNTSFPVTVTQTPTELSINATQQSVNGSAVGGPIVYVEGTLTADGTPVENRSVSITLNNSTTAVTTDNNGSYAANVTVPKSVFADQTGTTVATIGATFDGAETNLESSRRRTAIQLTVPSQTTSVFEQFVEVFAALPVTYQLLLGLGVVFVVVALVSVLRAWFGLSETGTTDPTTATLASDDTSPGEQRDGLPSLLATARERLSAGESESAVGLAYMAVRRALGRDPELGGARTHWEFLDACVDRGIGERRLGALRRLTEFYERATFSQRSLSTETASSALNDARTVAESDDPVTTDEQGTDSDSNSE